MYRRQDLDSSFYTSLTILFSENLNFPASDDLPFADFLTSDISTDHDTSVEELAAIAKKCVTAELSASQKEQKSATSQWQIQKEQERDGLYEPLIGLKSACLFQGSWEAASQSMSEMVEENARCNANKSIKTRLRKNALSRPGPKSLNSVNGQQNSLYLNSCKFKPSKHRSKAPRGVMRSKWMHTGGVRGGTKY
ncbi:CIC11C00000003846 [Sungouiella intermedia]|uniref:CIC11C00000003846 n=1 Tax=Sungouiella intermedia TaxID=45354 RepID=A0A1L0BXT1_9ASCO|nr:CIC11C00000003846 [[Candida] intermedia]